MLNYNLPALKSEEFQLDDIRLPVSPEGLQLHQIEVTEAAAKADAGESSWRADAAALCRAVQEEETLLCSNLKVAN